MGIGTGSAAIIGGIGAAGSLASSAIGAHAAGSAANAQVNAANHAADLQKQAADEALAFQKEQWATNQKNLAPWLSAGTQGINTLAGLLSTPGQGLLTPWTEQFSAPTGITEQNDPGFQSRLKFGQQAMDRSAAARGNLLTGGTAQAENQAAQDYASNEYGNVYNRAFNEYSNRYNVFQNNQTNEFNRLGALSGVGQTTANQLGTLGMNTANNVSGILMNSSNNIGQDYMNAGNARASGYINGANAWSSGIGGGTNNLMQLLLLSKLGIGGGGGGGGLGQFDPNAIGFCWVAAELYGGWEAPETSTIRHYLLTSTVPQIQRFAKLYAQHGREWAERIQRDMALRAGFRALFDEFLAKAVA